MVFVLGWALGVRAASFTERPKAKRIGGKVEISFAVDSAAGVVGGHVGAPVRPQRAV